MGSVLRGFNPTVTLQTYRPTDQVGYIKDTHWYRESSHKKLCRISLIAREKITFLPCRLKYMNGKIDVRTGAWSDILNSRGAFLLKRRV